MGGDDALIGLYTYGTMIATSPDTQYDIQFIADDIARHSYFEAALDTVGLLLPSVSGLGKYASKIDDGLKWFRNTKVGSIFDDVCKGIKGLFKRTSKAKFSSIEKLESHFKKHGKEFKGIYNNADEYLQGARDVMQNGTKVSYKYKGEIRTGYVKFMGNNSKGVAKFEFVGTNNLGDIATYHVESGKTFWKMLNGENIKIINPIN